MTPPLHCILSYPSIQGANLSLSLFDHRGNNFVYEITYESNHDKQPDHVLEIHFEVVAIKIYQAT